MEEPIYNNYDYEREIPIDPSIEEYYDYLFQGEEQWQILTVSQ